MTNLELERLKHAEGVKQLQEQVRREAIEKTRLENEAKKSQSEAKKSQSEAKKSQSDAKKRITYLFDSAGQLVLYVKSGDLEAFKEALNFAKTAPLCKILLK